MADGTLKVGTITTSSGSGTITLGQSGETISVPSGVTLTNNGTASGFGKVLQVVSMNLETEQSTTSTSFVSTNLTKAITPSATSSKILIIAAVANYINTASQDYTAAIYRGATNLSTNAFGRLRSNGGGVGGNSTFVYLDSPNTINETTYTYYHKVEGGTGYLSINNYLSSITLIEIGA
jgi:hypothetical protein